jgi:flagellar biogenesis protein FliO
MLRNNRTKSDRTKSYLIALVFIIIAIIGVWLTFREPSQSESPKQEEKSGVYKEDTLSQKKQVTGFKSDSANFSNYSKRTDSYSGGILKTVIITVLFIIFIVIGMMIFKKKFSSGKTFGMDLDILGKKYFGQKQFLLMVRVENRKLLLGITDDSINLIKDFGEIDDDERIQGNPEPKEQESNPFPKILKQISFNKD